MLINFQKTYVKIVLYLKSPLTVSLRDLLYVSDRYEHIHQWEVPNTSYIGLNVFTVLFLHISLKETGKVSSKEIRRKEKFLNTKLLNVDTFVLYRNHGQFMSHGVDTRNDLYVVKYYDSTKVRPFFSFCFTFVSKCQSNTRMIINRQITVVITKVKV